ncbi:MAG: phosphatase PAP2 family protein [Deltaproteobacteria bacterium]|jgi:undecaprenyl-diphosphatase|nr:phosphatase PAP2 family protein [Deltaproteobacteria bacterium]
MMVRNHPIKSLVFFYAHHVTLVEAHMMERFCSLRHFSWITRIFKTISRLGDGPLWIGTGICLLSVNDSHTQRVAFAAALAVGLSVLLFMCVKNLIGRPRPFEAWQELTCLMAPPDKFSFPSGHTMTAFSIWGAFFVGIPLLSHFYLLIALLIGLSRIFLGLHYPTDVLVGAVLGGSIGYGLASYII